MELIEEYKSQMDDELYEKAREEVLHSDEEKETEEEKEEIQKKKRGRKKKTENMNETKVS